jgi:hypothetical protein
MRARAARMAAATSPPLAAGPPPLFADAAGRTIARFVAPQPARSARVPPVAVAFSAPYVLGATTRAKARWAAHPTLAAALAEEFGGVASAGEGAREEQQPAASSAGAALAFWRRALASGRATLDGQRVDPDAPLPRGAAGRAVLRTLLHRHELPVLAAEHLAIAFARRGGREGREGDGDPRAAPRAPDGDVRSAPPAWSFAIVDKPPSWPCAPSGP